MSDTATGREYAVHELLDMDEQTARESLTVNQYERWEKLTDLHEEAEQTKAEWDQQAETVEELTVHADPEQLGTAVDVFGNDLLVHIDSEDSDFRAAAERLEDIQTETPDDESANIDPERVDAAADALTAMLDTVIVRWNGHNWRGLTDDRRAAILDDAREKWGADGLLLAWMDIGAAVAEDREERVDVIEKFRNPERRGNR